MPIFEYKCSKCSESKEAIQREPSGLICECGAPMERTIELPSFKLKGDNWAHNGYTYRKDFPYANP